MNKPAKIAVIIVSVTLVLAITLMVALVVLVDPNDFRDEIAQRVKESSGRELRINGSLELSFFPTLGLKLGDTSLSNPPGFGDTPFLQVREAQLSAALLPLLRNELVVDRVILKSPRVHLLTLADGRNNWETASEPADNVPESGAAPPPTGNDRLAAITLGGISLADARISYENRMDNTHYLLDELNLEVGAFSNGKPFDVELHTRIGGIAPDRTTELGLGAEMVFDLHTGNLQVRQLEIMLPPAKLNGEMTLQGLGGDLSFQGKLDLARFNPRELLPNLGVEAPATTDKNALTEISARFSFQGTPDRIQISPFHLGLDKTTLEGDFLWNGKLPEISLNLAVDTLDLDAYLPPTTASGDQRTGESTTSPTSATDSASNLAEFLESLKTLKAEGKITIQSLKVGGITSKDVELRLKARDGRIETPLKAALYGGELEGAVTVNSRTNPPEFAVTQRLQGVEMDSLGQALFQSGMLSGSARATLDVTTRGQDSKQVVRNLGGTFDAELENGSINGFNLDGIICRGQQTVKALRGSESAQCPTENRTRFSAFRTDGSIQAGVLHIQELFLEQPRQDPDKFLHVTGTGTVDLNTTRLDMRVQARSVRSTGNVTQPYETRGEAIPVSITGTFREPQIRPDFQQALQGKAATKLKNKLLEKLDENGDAESSPEDQLKKQLLKGLFGQ